MTRVVAFDADVAEYIGNEEDGVYVQAGQDHRGFYVTCVVDCDSASFVDNLGPEMGPYIDENKALCAGRIVAIDWCLTNGVEL